MSKIKYVPQMMQTECGLCCIVMIANYYNHYITLSDLRKYQQPGREGMSIRNICQILKRIQFDYKLYKCDVSGLKQLRTPLIAYWNKAHFVVIEKITSRNVFVVDPAIGRVIYSIDEFEQGFSNTVVVPFPTKSIVLKSKPKSIWLSFIPMLFDDKKVLGGIFIFSLISYLLSLAIPNYIRKIIDTDGQISITILLMGFAILFGYAFSYFINALLGILLKTKVYRKFYKKVFKKLKNAEYRYFESRPTGGIIYSLNSVATVNEFYAAYVITSLVSLGASIVLLIYFAWMSRIIFMLLMCGIILFAIAFMILNKRTILFNQAEISSQAKLSSIQTELVSSIESIKISGMENKLFCQWESEFDKTVDKKKSSDMARASSTTLLTIMTVALPIFILYVSLFMAERGEMTVGTSISIYSIAVIAVGHIVTVLTSLN